MHFKEILPWNWGKKSVPVHRAPQPEVPLVEPENAMFGLQRSINRGFDEFFEGFGWPGELTGRVGRFVPALDASETDEAYTISLELPGIDEENVTVTLSDDALTIEGEKSEERERDEGGAHWVERSYGSFRRVVPLPSEVDASAVNASFKRGVLSISLPKTEASREQARSIPIEVG
jgi:HSP20 family protein